MSWTTQDLATIDAAIASGVRRIKFSDREMEYPSIDELKNARTEIVNFLAQSTGTPQRRMVMIYTKSGF